LIINSFWTDAMTEKAGPGIGPGVGSLLRASRLRIGEDLRDVAAALYIRYIFLNAIEEGRYEALPGPTYAVGFVRVYAEHLGLDAAEVVRRFKAETAALSEIQELVFPSPLPESGLPNGTILATGVFIAVLAYGIWYFNSANDKSITDLIPAVPEQFATLFGPGSGEVGGSVPAPMTTATPQASKPTISSAPTAPEPKETANPGPAGDAGAAETVTSPAEQPTVDVAAVTPQETAAVAESRPIDPRPENIVVEQELPTTSGPPSAAPVFPMATDSTSETPSASASQETTVAREPIPERAIPGRPVETEAAPEVAAVPVPVENPATPIAVPVDAVASSVERVEAPPPLPPSPPANEFSGLTHDGVQAGDVNGPVSVGRTDRERASNVNAAQTKAAAVATVEAASVEAAPSDSLSQGSSGRIVVSARFASWIQVRDEVAKQLLMTRLMQPGDTYTVPDRPGLKLLTGNAGALEIRVDGETMPAIGPIGAVRRDIALDIERLKNGTAGEN
jgi:cytoskeleton protein RodZ